MSIHEEVQELVPALTLGALDSDEARRVNAHLASCSVCSRVLEEYRPVAESLAYATPTAELPRHLKTRTLQRALQPRPGPGARPRALPSRPWWQRPGLATALAGAALIIALVALGWNTWQMIQLNQQVATQRSFMTFLAYAQGTPEVIRGTPLAPEATGRLYLDPDSNLAELVTVDMPALDANHVYQVWLTGPNGKVSGGMFTVDDARSGWLWVRTPQPLTSYSQVEVSIEPRGGSSGQTTPSILLAQLTSP